MKRVELVQLLLRLNTRVECTKVSKDTGWPVCRTAEGVRVPENPSRYCSDFTDKAKLSDVVAQAYYAMKPQVDELYIEWAKALNQQIDREIGVYKVGPLNTQLSAMWGKRVGVKLYASQLLFPEGPVNLHLSHGGKDTVRIRGYSLGDAL